MLQLIFKLAEQDDEAAVSAPVLAGLQDGQEGVIESLNLPEDVARRLMELGFLPGASIAAARSAPGGDPKVFRVDGSEIALRRETAMHIRLQDSARHSPQ